MSNLNNFANPWDKITDEKNYTCTGFAAILVVFGQEGAEYEGVTQRKSKTFRSCKDAENWLCKEIERFKPCGEYFIARAFVFPIEGYHDIRPKRYFFAGGLGVKSN